MEKSAPQNMVVLGSELAEAKNNVKEATMHDVILIRDDGEEEEVSPGFVPEHRKFEKGDPGEEVKDEKVVAVETTMVVSGSRLAETKNDDKEAAMNAIISEAEKVEKGDMKEESKDRNLEAIENNANLEEEKMGQKYGEEDVKDFMQIKNKRKRKSIRKRQRNVNAAALSAATSNAVTAPVALLAAGPISTGFFIEEVVKKKKKKKSIRKRQRKVDAAAPSAAASVAATSNAVTAPVVSLAADPTSTGSVVEEVSLTNVGCEGNFVEIMDAGKDEAAPADFIFIDEKLEKGDTGVEVIDEKMVAAETNATPKDNKLGGKELKFEKDDEVKDDGKLASVSNKKTGRMKKRQRKLNAAAATATATTSKTTDDTGLSAGEKDLKNDEAGLIFMCSAKTKQDCFRYMVLGLPESKKEIVSKVYKGMRLFLFDFDLKLMYGIFKAASPGGYNIEPKAFQSKFPSQVRFSVLRDCLPLAEEKFKPAIKANYYGRGKFDTKLSAEQVKNLCKLFEKANKSPKRTKQPARPRQAELASGLNDDRERRNPAVRRSKNVYSRGPTYPAREAYTSLPAPAASTFNDEDRERRNPAVRLSEYVYPRGQTFHAREVYASPLPPPAASDPTVRGSEYVYSRSQAYHPREAYVSPHRPSAGLPPPQPLAPVPPPPLAHYVYTRPVDDYYIRRDPRDPAVDLRGYRVIDVETRPREAVTYHDPYSYYREPATYRDPATYQASGLPSASLTYQASGLPSASLPPSAYRG